MSRFHETNVKFANHGPRMNEHANLERSIPTAISAKSGKWCAAPGDDENYVYAIALLKRGSNFPRVAAVGLLFAAHDEEERFCRKICGIPIWLCAT
jgi:hypothetical protein